jgi:hypothetical protein
MRDLAMAAFFLNSTADARDIREAAICSNVFAFWNRLAG